MPSLSVCMIVRDEERNLETAIESVRTVAREVVVVDTGSRDRTVDIARAHGARVLCCPWQDDFSLARNVALEAARCDWILTLDADQLLEPDSLPALTAAMQRTCRAQIVTIKMMAPDGADAGLSTYRALRLFRRDTRVRYQGRVHEDVAGALIEIGSVDWPDSNVVLRDTGYVSASERQKKRERNLVLLERARSERPDDLFIAYKLALTLPEARLGERRELLSGAIRAARSLSTQELRELPFLPAMLAAAVDACVEQGRLCEAAAMAQSLLPALGTRGCFTAGQAVARTGQAALASGLLAQFLESDPVRAHGSLQPDPAADVADACRWLGWLSRLSGDPAGARSWLGRALQTATPSQCVAVECELVRVHLAEGDMTGVSDRLQRLYPAGQASVGAGSELMLVSAEIACAVGDNAGALELARAAVVVSDDRAAALRATLELRNGDLGEQRLQQLLRDVSGRRFDTLAVRVRLARCLGLELSFEVPAATQELAR